MKRVKLDRWLAHLVFAIRIGDRRSDDLNARIVVERRVANFGSDFLAQRTQLARIAPGNCPDNSLLLVFELRLLPSQVRRETLSREPCE